LQDCILLKIPRNKRQEPNKLEKKQNKKGENPGDMRLDSLDSGKVKKWN